MRVATIMCIMRRDGFVTFCLKLVLMIPGIYSVATAMDQATLRHEMVARNLAHTDIPGYRRAILRQQTFESAMSEASQKMLRHDSLGVSSGGEDVDLTPGAFHRTNSPLDFAIQGNGYFVIEGPNGPLYTKNGAFQVNADGRLVTADGLPVAADSGSLTLPLNSSPSQLIVQSDGTAFVNGSEIGRIKLAQFQNPHALISRGVTLFGAPDDITPLDSDAQVIQGTRERSNVHPVQELVELIAASRAHDAAQRAMRSLHDAIEHHTALQQG
ncbi:MAG: flagellar hook basal-body protein [Planctomycetaceae bacterium]